MGAEPSKDLPTNAEVVQTLIKADADQRAKEESRKYMPQHLSFVNPSSSSPGGKTSQYTPTVEIVE